MFLQLEGRLCWMWMYGEKNKEKHIIVSHKDSKACLGACYIYRTSPTAKECSIGFINVLEAARKMFMKLWLVVQASCIGTAQWKFTLYQVMTYTNVRTCSVLCGLRVSMIMETFLPVSMAAQRLTLPLWWPGTSTLARLPVIFILFARLNSASSIKIDSWGFSLGI